MKKILLIFALFVLYSCSSGDDVIIPDQPWEYTEFGGTGMFSIPLIDQEITLKNDNDIIFLPVIYNGGFTGVGEVKSQTSENIIFRTDFTDSDYFFKTIVDSYIDLRMNFSIAFSVDNTNVNYVVIGAMRWDGSLIYFSGLYEQQTSNSFDISINTQKPAGASYSTNKDAPIGLGVFIGGSKKGDKVRLKISNVGNISIDATAQ